MAFRDVPLPVKGYSEGLPASNQPALTTGYMNNVRPKDILAKRIRIGQRPGLIKWSTDQVGSSTQPVVAMAVLSSTT
jgi:hypothetical protein